ncbi:MAG: alpha-amylase [Anaerolineae bacterium]|nr:alpha-amylase [Anaerolineae bacterium]
MSFADTMLGQPRPDRLADFNLPRRERYFPSPADWRDETLYFLLPDRFSDGQEDTRPLLDPADRQAARPALPNGETWRWDRWAESGKSRWQGGTLQGVQSKLGYLKDLGVRTLWVGPVFKQRGHADSYHGYGIQDFLEVDPHLGNRQDLVNLVTAAHGQGLRIILDIIFNHSGPNWLYPDDTPGGPDMPPYQPDPKDRYPFGHWRGDQGQAIAAIQGSEDGVWPVELQDTDDYTRAGKGSLAAGDINDPQAEHKRTDFYTLRDFQLTAPDGSTRVLNFLARCYKYWIALTDCDGFRIDTLKHVTLEEGRNFCGSIKEFAANLGKADFFLVGEVGGGDFTQTRFLNVLDRNLNAALDIGEMRPTLTAVAKGLQPPDDYFAGFDPSKAVMGSHRNLGLHHVSILDDHDHISGVKIRFSAEADSDHQVVAGVGLQLFSLGIPCVYYGTEQAFAGPEPSERPWLPSWKETEYGERYLREAMFGPLHPLKAGTASLPPGPDNVDPDLPGFGPFGTAGRHAFNPASPAYVRIAAMTALRHGRPVLRYGRQYPRKLSNFGQPFDFPPGGELIAWSRILDDEEALCVINGHGRAARGGDVNVDPSLNPPGSQMTVILNTAQAADPAGYHGAHPVGSTLPVRRKPDNPDQGIAYVEIRDLAPSEVLVLTNYP